MYSFSTKVSNSLEQFSGSKAKSNPIFSLWFMPEIEQGNRTASSSEPILQGTMDPAIFRGYQQLSALPQIVVMENWALCRGSNLSRSCDSQELCSYGGRMLSFVGLFAYWGSSSALLGLHSSWVAVGSLIGSRVADREAEAGEKKERDFFHRLPWAIAQIAL